MAKCADVGVGVGVGVGVSADADATRRCRDVSENDHLTRRKGTWSERSPVEI